MTEPTDDEIVALAIAEGVRVKTGTGAIRLVRAALSKWGAPAPVWVEPVAWLSTDCIGERYLCFTKPKDSDPARPLVFGDTTPQPTQAQAVAVPLTYEQIRAMARKHTVEDLCSWSYHMGVADAERHHGIKGGQHG